MQNATKIWGQERCDKADQRGSGVSKSEMLYKVCGTVSPNVGLVNALASAVTLMRFHVQMEQLLWDEKVRRYWMSVMMVMLENERLADGANERSKVRSRITAQRRGSRVGTVDAGWHLSSAGGRLVAESDAACLRLSPRTHTKDVGASNVYCPLVFWSLF
jgi:hypothetical protein